MTPIKSATSKEKKLVAITFSNTVVLFEGAMSYSGGLPAHSFNKLPSKVRKYILPLEQTIESCGQRIAGLESRVKDLEGQLAQNSQNSSKPPSSDGPKGRSIPGSQRGKTGKKPGGQPGHPGTTLRRVKNPDRIVTHTVEKCQHCDHCLSGVKSHSTEERQVTDLPQLKLEVTSHIVESKECPNCEKTTTASFPPGVDNPVGYGPRIKAFGIYLTQQQLLPCKRASGIIEDLFGHTISAGTFCDWAKTASENLSLYERVVIKMLGQSPVAHFDETGMRCEKIRHWLHVCSTQHLTLYSFDKKRGEDAMREMGILPVFTGVAVHDHWKPYFLFEGCSHSLCNSHHLRELKFLYEEHGETWAAEMRDLLQEIHQTVEEAKVTGKDELSQSIRQEYIKAYERILKKGYSYHDKLTPLLSSGDRGRKKQRKGKNLLDRLREFNGAVLRFMNNFQIPFTNNQGEQDIRMTKVKQKISGCFRSFEGALYFCRIRGYLSTGRKQGWNLLSSLEQVFRGQPILPVRALTS
ncbi:MAG: IS66 family transposase [Nitrososphaerales archaeon]